MASEPFRLGVVACVGVDARQAVDFGVCGTGGWQGAGRVSGWELGGTEGGGDKVQLEPLRHKLGAMQCL